MCAHILHVINGWIKKLSFRIHLCDGWNISHHGIIINRTMGENRTFFGVRGMMYPSKEKTDGNNRVEEMKNLKSWENVNAKLEFIVSGGRMSECVKEYRRDVIHGDNHVFCVAQ